VETEIHAAFADPTVFAPGDSVLLFPQLDEDGEWVPGTGTAFVCDGVVYDGRKSPWPLFSKCLGGMVRLRRVT
jgi:hypothetical protein